MSKTREKMFDIARRTSIGGDMVTLHRINESFIKEKRSKKAVLDYTQGYDDGAMCIAKINNLQIKRAIQWEIRLGGMRNAR